MITLMIMSPRPPVHGLVICAVVVLALGRWEDGRAQEWKATPSLAVGPTLESRAVTARSLLGTDEESPSIQVRYSAYEREFARAFGYPLLGPAGPHGQSFWAGLEEWLNARWGDSTFLGWVERSLVLYARIQASTQFEKRGFNMDLDMDDVAKGKFGVRLSRSLESQ